MDIGIVGYGNIAKKHHEAIKQLSDIKLTAIYDNQALDIDNKIKVCSSLNELLELDLDLISVCSPNGFHQEHSISALRKGHHVICEKPFALTEQDCAAMITAAVDSGKKIFCTMQNRFSSVSQWLKQLIDEKALGEIYLVNVSCYWNRNKDYYKKSDWRGKADIDGGTLFTQFSHYVDTLYWLFGDLKINDAIFKNFDHEEMIDFEDTGIFNFKITNGGMGTFAYTTSCFEKNFESTMTIIGSDGTVKVAGQYMNQIEYCNIKNRELPQLEQKNNIDNLKEVYLNVKAHLENNASILTPPTDGLKVVKIIEEVYQFKS